MKINTLPRILPNRRALMTLALNVGLLAGMTIPLHAADNAKGAASAGTNNDEWYDPGDWFDGNNAEKNGNDRTSDDNVWSDNYDSAANAANASNKNAANVANKNAANAAKAANKKAAKAANKNAAKAANKNAANAKNHNNSHTSNTGDSQDSAGAGVEPYYYYYWDPVVVDWIIYIPADSNSKAKKDVKTFDGKVDGFRSVNLKGTNGETQQQSFVRVRLKNGDASVISLGCNVDMADLNLQKGDNVSVTGKSARLDGQNVLMANRIVVDNQTFRIHKKNDADAGKSVSIQGTVKDFSKTSLNGEGDKNLLVRIDLKNGKSCVVDLGQGTTVEKLGLNQGSTIQISGRRTKVNDKKLIVADKIRVDGQNTRIHGVSTTNQNADVSQLRNHPGAKTGDSWKADHSTHGSKTNAGTTTNPGSKNTPGATTGDSWKADNPAHGTKTNAGSTTNPGSKDDAGGMN